MRTILVELLTSLDGLKDLTYGSGRKTSPSIYSLQDALSQTDGEGSPFRSHREFYSTSPRYPNLNYNVPVYVFVDACQRGNTTFGSCTDACNHTFDIMFDPVHDLGQNPLANLHNCVVLPNITTTAAQNVSAFSTAGYDDTVNTVLLDGLYDQEAANASKVISTISECLLAYCDSLNGCMKHFSYATGSRALSNETVYGSTGWGEQLVDTICTHVPLEIQSDVGGIGVYSSYWAQQILALFGFTLTLWWMFVAPFVYRAVYALRKGSKTADQRHELAERVCAKHVSRLGVALVDFQKAQAIFMIATSIAAIIVTKEAGLEAESLQQIYNTGLFLRLVGVSGFLPVSFTLFNLYILDMLSTYVMGLSAISYFLAIGTLVSVGDFKPSKEDLKYLSGVASKGGPESCGGRQPGVYCYQSLESTTIAAANIARTNIGARAFSVFAFCIFVTIFLIFMKIWALHGRSLTRYGKKTWHQSKPTRSRARAEIVRLWARVRSTPTGARCERTIERYWHHPKPRSMIHSIARYGKASWTYIRTFLTSNYSRYPLPPHIEAYLHQLSRLCHRQLQNTKSHLRKTIPLAKFNTQPKHTLLLRILLLTTHIIFFSIYISYFVSFLSDLSWFATSKTSKTDGWTFGQVVALSVWLPPLFEYAYLELRGVRKGFQYRLRPGDYKVVGLRNLSWVREDGKEEEDEGRGDGGESGGEERDVEAQHRRRKEEGDEEVEMERKGSEGTEDAETYLLPEPELPSRIASLRWSKVGEEEGRG